MPASVVQSPQARKDLRKCHDSIARDNVAAARRFLQAVDKAFALLATMPTLGSPYERPAVPDLRVWTVRGFPRYLIFYRPAADGIEVLRVVHGARDIDRLLEDL